MVAIQILSLLVLAVAMMALWWWLLRWRYRRATAQVFSAFRRNGALSPQGARTLPELGIRPPPLFGLRDYRRLVLRALVGAGVIVAVEDNRYYLSEERLEALRQQGGKPG